MKIGDRVRVINECLGLLGVKQGTGGRIISPWVAFGFEETWNVLFDGQDETRSLRIRNLELETYDLETLDREVLKGWMGEEKLKKILQENPNLQNEFIR
jgi:hypothetical protein